MAPKPQQQQQQQQRGASSTALLIYPALGVAISVAASAALWWPGGLSSHPLFQRTSCPFTLPNSQRATRNLLPQLDAYVCSVRPLYTQLASTRAAKGSSALLLSVLLPVLMRQGYVATSPNTRSALLGPLAVVVVHLLARAVGSGAALCSLGTLLVTLGSLAQSRSGGPERIPLAPTPASGVYFSNLCIVLLGGAALLQGILSPSSPSWSTANTLYLFSPLLLAALFTLATLLAPRRATTASEARKQLMEYGAEEVAYTYERTWSYYRKVGLASAALYWYGLSRLGKGLYYHADEQPLKDGVVRLNLAEFALASVFLLFTILVERAILRPMDPSPSPSSGQLRADCLRALSLAPAGNPSLEQRRGPLAPCLAALIGGPGLVASLWWSGGEEEAGWFARRAWRETRATVLEKKEGR